MPVLSLGRTPLANALRSLDELSRPEARFPLDLAFCPQCSLVQITESVPLSHFSLCHSVLSEVRSRGVLLAVDDLGAGYSNLKYIADLSPEVVKLDRGLIVNLQKGTRQHRLVRAIVRLCEDLGTKVVAEGIETEEEARAVLDSGAHYGQGFFFARPSYPPPPINLEHL